ncbi:hypothetical protein PROFUN_14099 [Planoprotostelium fungivorum]|uniref:Peptidase M28 domain-containing protein n=1 Tax=Planoprotostelium fungivorum TaxID=1890364 RepID=A0A2P6N206_9EUKA|nr:hypothetical protein PROFUN_14099 [Planoprotostelium fungivorum]
MANYRPQIDDRYLNDNWNATDDLLNTLLVQSDDALQATLSSHKENNLPEISVAPNQGKFLSLLVSIKGCKSILEVGTLAGYSTIWLAKGMSAGGHLFSLEYDPERAELSRKNIERAGFSQMVTVITGDARESLVRLKNEGKKFDFVFIDADKENYPVYLDHVLDMSSSGTVIVADNVVRQGKIVEKDHEDDRVRGAREFLEKLGSDKRVKSTAVQTVGCKGHDGFSLSIRTLEKVLAEFTNFFSVTSLADRLCRPSFNSMRATILFIAVFVTAITAIDYPPKPSVEGSWRLLQFSDEHVEWVPHSSTYESINRQHLHSWLLTKKVTAKAAKVLTEAKTTAKLGVGFVDRTSHYESGARSFTPEAPEDDPSFPTPDPSSHSIVQKMFPWVNSNMLKKTVTDLSNFNTRYYLSEESTKGPDYLAKHAKKIADKYKAKDVQIKQISNDGFNQNNIVVILPAKQGVEKKDDIVVVGGHLDSVAYNVPEGRAPGADDDASGSSIVMETFRILVEAGWRGSRDVHFMFFAAEEGGLLGSGTVAKQYKENNVQVRAMLQMEMCGYQLGDPVITVLHDPNPPLSSWLSTLVDNYLPNVTSRTSTCGYGCSDHDSWSDQGYPAACISEAGPNDSGLNPNMHTPEDLPTILNFEAMAVFVRAGLAWVVELAQ